MFAVFVLIVQLVERYFCLFNGASFVYLACLWTLLRRKTDAFTMSFRRVCGVKRVCLRRFFQRKTDVFAVFVLIVQLVGGHFCLLNRRFSCTLVALNRRVCGCFGGAKRAILACHAVVARTHTTPVALLTSRGA